VRFKDLTAVQEECSWTALWARRWRHYDPMKHWELLPSRMVSHPRILKSVL